MKQCKSLLILALALLLILSVTACGSGNNGNANPSMQQSSSENTNPPTSTVAPSVQTTTTTDNKPADSSPATTVAASAQNTTTADSKPADSNINEVMGNLFDWTKSGVYYYEVETTSAFGDNVSHYYDIKAKDGDDFASVTIEKEEDGTIKRQIHSFKKGDKIIVINDLEKSYMEMPPELLALSGEVQDAFGEMELIGEGTGEINGKTLSYEEYDTNGITTRYFFDNDQVYGYTSELVFGTDKVETVSIITKQSNVVPADLFQIPAGYTEVKQ